MSDHPSQTAADDRGPVVEAASWPAALAAFLDYIIAECGLARNTLVAYRRDLKEFVAFAEEAGTASPVGVTLALVQRHLAALYERGLSAPSIVRHVVSIKVFLRYLALTGRASSSVADLLELPKRGRSLPDTLGVDEVNHLLQMPPPEGELAARDRAILEFFYATGLRVSELAGLRLADVNLDVGFLRCFGKGGRERIVPVGQPAIEAVRAYLSALRPGLVAKRPDESALFVSRSGRAMERTALWRLVSRYGRAAGLRRPVGPHTLRHCFATHVLRGGADIRVVQELLGHADVSTTQIYTHVDNERLSEVHRRCHPRP